jgi:hypothetical protein
MAKYSIGVVQVFGGLWKGYVSGRSARQFFGDNQEAQAQAWLLQQNRAEVEARWGARLAQLQFGHNRTALSVDTQDVGLAAALVQVAEEKQLPVLAVPVEKGRAKRQAWIRITVKAAAHDIEVTGVGDSVLLFSGQTAEGVDWLDAHLQSGPRLGSSRAVEHRFAGAIIEGAAADGLRVRVL